METESFVEDNQVSNSHGRPNLKNQVDAQRPSQKELLGSAT